MPVKTAERVLDLFEAFAELQRAATLSELARKLDIPVSSCFGLLRTIERRGYLYSAKPRGGLYPTQRILALARTIAAHDPIATRVSTVLRDLRDATEETVLFAKRSGDRVVLLDVMPSQQRVRYTADIGDMRDLHSTSLGKALLAQMPAKERAALLAKLELARRTRETLTSRAKLDAELAKSAKRGWYTNAGESVEHIFAVAVPVTLHGDHYAVSLVGPMERMKPALARLVAELARLKLKIEVLE